MKIFLFGALSSVVFLFSCHAAFSSPVGAWLANDGSKIRISSCGPNLCGHLAQPSPPIDPDTGKPWKDKKNADPAKRNRPLLGVEILISMKPKSPGNGSGRLYNADDGKIYDGNLIELDGSSVRIEGCSMGVCGGETLTRLK
jgi:uncharacterized protein (DUF2147 family)